MQTLISSLRTMTSELGWVWWGKPTMLKQEGQGQEFKVILGYAELETSQN